MDFRTKIALSTGKIKPEFGNLEHINFLKEAEFVEDRLKKGIQPTFEQSEVNDEFANYLLVMRITCVCGATVVADDYTLFDQEHEVFDDCDFWCNHCNRDYHAELVDENIVVKLS